MFWGKKTKEKNIKGTSEQFEPKVVPPKITVNSLTLRRNVLDWRDKHTAQIELHLRRELTVLMSLVDEELDKLSLIKSTIKIRQVTKHTIQPLLSSWISRESEYLLEEARNELLSIHGLVLGTLEHGEEIEIHESKKYIIDTISATSVGICGLSVIPLFTSASVVTAGGLAGLFGATVVSLPLLGCGLLLATLSFAVCGHRLSELKQRAVKRYRGYFLKSINSSILGDSERKELSLNDQLQNLILRASNDIIRGIQE